jgi:uncharacterized SAM-binding protein YcdF (DUF218 family)
VYNFHIDTKVLAFFADNPVSHFVKDDVGLMLRKPITIIVLCTVTIIICLGIVAFRQAGLWLIVSDPLPRSLDVIFTFGSEPGRINYSKQLLAKYQQSLWIDSYQNKFIKQTFAQQGLDTSRIRIVDTCKNTFSEVACASEWVDNIIKGAIALPEQGSLKAKQFSSSRKLHIGFVSDPYHMRRIQITVKKKLTNPLCEYYLLAVPFDQSGYSRLQYKYWWRNNDLHYAISSELKKIVYYIFK